MLVSVTDYDRAAELGGALQARLAEVRFPLSPATESEIQQSVCAYADELKALGVPPERVIIAVKRTANDAGVFTSPRLIEPRARVDGTDKLLVDMVRWCIQRYYGPPSVA